MRKKLRSRILGGVIIALLVAYYFCLPKDLFKGTSYSTVVTDRNGELLGARIASDGQWRFPPSDTVPEKFRTALIEFEDRWFAYHPGVNPVSIARAAAGNIKAGHVTSGGSTITMQVIRMSRGRERNIGQKIIEAILATRLELRCSKNEIIGLYASHAPFGGNVVGLEAASWRYFGRPPDELSWGEAATLAVLPNSPGEIHPGKNRTRLLEKRNRLLGSLYRHGHIDSLDFVLARDEPLPGEPVALPQEAHHLTEYYWKTSPGKRIKTAIDIHLQKQIQAVTDQWNNEFSQTGIHDLAAIVKDVRTGETLAYIGNANPDRKRPGGEVDIIRAPRSTGSILKPLLYCALLQDGEILPNTLLPDVPININGFSPQNFNRQFYGAVPASEALARSLNVPSVHLLRRFGVAKFLDILRKCGMTTLKGSASHYGLSLILGGAEGTLGDITSIYSKLSASYQSADTTHTSKGDRLHNFPLKDKCALWWTFDALKEVNRPDEIDWRLIGSIKKVAWKTGTSFGFRDAWAVGVTADYAVGVWAGNAQGQGVPGLTGARTAGPVMFEIFNLLPIKEYDSEYSRNGWFKEPVYGDYIIAEVCRESGCLKGVSCESSDTLMLPRKSVKSEPCPHHKVIDGVRTFILPPSMEWYYRQHHPEYTPAMEKGKTDSSPMEFIYPENGAVIYIPRQLDGSITGITFNLAHRTPKVNVFWHLDNEYVGQTQMIHQLTLKPSPGKHSVTAVDESGNSISVGFTVADNK
ncbi:MAG TPA: penicillin-binding protein 1C [Rikenellaceae bacterium]|nr:penicillin-binding protein 1C [Rikenellaceae bacterium]